MIKRSFCLFLISLSFQGCILLIPFAEKNEKDELASGITVYQQPPLYSPFPRRIIRDRESIKLTLLLKSKSPAIRTTAVTNIGAYKRYHYLINEVKELAYDPSKNVRRAVVKTLARIDPSGSKEILKRLSNDKDYFVAETAKHALAGDNRYLGPSL